MFDLRQCATSGCDRTALHQSEYCAVHHPDPQAYADEALSSMQRLVDIRDRNYAGLRFEGANLSGKRFHSCSFSNAVLKNVIFSSCVFRMCFFDFCDSDSCDFSEIDAQFCSFAGARFLGASFEHSELVHDNFDGAMTTECTFNKTNLYNSRFIMAELEKTDFMDCNLKRSFIIPARETEVSWRLSNTAEAIHDLEGLDP